ncbi:MAG: ureidoglycolate lyase [Cyanobacteria bacterium P01_A01_bin.114]
MAVQTLKAKSITAETFQPFGQVIFPQRDDKPFGPNDARLELDGGIPRFYIMKLQHRGTRFSTITRHQACTQCLGSLEGKPWLMGVAPPGDAAAPSPEDIQVFQIPGNCFIKLEVGTWHAGPYFECDRISFYNLELSDTNIVDHDTCDLTKTYGLIFEIDSHKIDAL